MRFDIDRFVEKSAKLDLTGIDFEAFKDQPLDESTLRCLRYMHDVEFHTICYLRDLLVTRAHADPEMTTFLSIWAWEEMWHGEAIAKVLQAHEEVAGKERVEAKRESLGKVDRLAPLVNLFASMVFKNFSAVHMAWGAVNEWTTQSGYARLAARAQHPVLSELLGRIMKQEGKHIDFYASQAKERLGASRKAQRLTRWLLRHKWGPVGSGVMPDEEVRFLTTHLFGDENGLSALERVDRNVDRLPGLGGLHLLRGARQKFVA